MGLNLGGRTRILIGAVTIGIYGCIAVLAWDGPRWISFIFGPLGAYRAWIWVKQLRWYFADDDAE